MPLGIVGAAAEAGGVIGPLWGGVIIRYLDWRWVFWINIPLAALTVALILLMLRPSPRFPASVDVVGGALVAAALTCTTLAVSRIGSFDWMGGVFVAGGVLSLVLFILRQQSATDPLLPPAMFRVLAFVTANITHLLVGAALIIGMVTVPLMANTVMGRTPLEGGLWLMRMTAGIPVGTMLGGLMAQRLDLRVPATAGLVIASIGFWLISGWALDIAEPELTLHLLVVGFGFGLLIVPIALAGTETVGEDIRATAASMVTALRIVGMTFGVAALTAWGVARFDVLAADIRLPLAEATQTRAEAQAQLDQFTNRINDAGITLFQEFFVIAAAVCLLAVVSAVLMIVNKTAGRRTHTPTGDADVL